MVGKLFSLVFIATFLICCTEENPNYRLPDYKTNHGISVFVDMDDAPGPLMVEHWTEQTMDFWKSRFPHWLLCMYDTNRIEEAWFHEEDHVSVKDFPYAGVSYGNRIEISNGTIDKVRGVFIHELSHSYFSYCTDYNNHHVIFREQNLCSLAKYC